MFFFKFILWLILSIVFCDLKEVWERSALRLMLRSFVWPWPHRDPTVTWPAFPDSHPDENVLLFIEALILEFFVLFWQQNSVINSSDVGPFPQGWSDWRRPPRDTDVCRFGTNNQTFLDYYRTRTSGCFLSNSDIKSLHHKIDFYKLRSFSWDFDWN